MTTVVNAATTIDEVIDRLDAIVARAQAERSALGYFAALYRAVTIRVRDDINLGRFENGERMARLDVVFANRYLDALARHRAGERTSLSWEASFAAARDFRPIVLQHLLTGMNAHINLDLGIAAAEAASTGELASLRADFDAINGILREMTGDIQDRLTRVWPGLAWLDLISGEADESLVHFSLERARDAAWAAAERLSLLEGDARQREIERIDLTGSILARLILNPGPKIALAAAWIRLREGGDVARIMGLLA